MGLQEDPLASVVAQASLPAKRVSQYLMTVYISRTHHWWPMIHLPSLRQWFQDIYTSPRTCSSFQRYVVFMVMSIGVMESQSCTKDHGIPDIFTAQEYFAAAIRFLDQAILGTNLQSLQALLLLTIWMTRSSQPSDNASLWQISRFAMSMAIELGCHRNNPSWDFGHAEREMRNRVWWCVYALER